MQPTPVDPPPLLAGPVADVRDRIRLLAGLGTTPLPRAAARIAAAGLPVFPCRAGQKRPLTEHGLLDATNDDGQVTEWWRRWPAANIGLPTGARSGLIVLDVDVRPTGTGFPTFHELTRRGLADGWAGLVRTPSGGLHAYYPAHAPERCWQDGHRHLDFRGDGGYVVIPPSLIRRSDGGSADYRVARVSQRRPQPVDADAIRDLLLPHLRRATPTSTPQSGRTRLVGPGADADRLASWVAARGEGERNRGLFWAACRLAETGAPTEQILRTLGPAAAHAGLPDAEIATTIRSATRTAAPVGSAGAALPTGGAARPEAPNRASPKPGLGPR